MAFSQRDTRPERRGKQRERREREREREIEREREKRNREDRKVGIYRLLSVGENIHGTISLLATRY